MPQTDRLTVSSRIPTLASLIVGALLIASWTSANDQRVSTETNVDNIDPAVVHLANGNTVYVWSTDFGGCCNRDIVLRRFDAQGQALDAQPVLVNTFSTGVQETPSVAADGSGAFVVTWHLEADAPTEGIRGQRFGSDGLPVGGEFVVNGQMDGFQVRPSIAMGDDGAFVVAWETTSFDGDGSGIAARLFDSTGTPLGNDFLVNEITTGRQDRPAVAMDASGRFVVVWGLDFDDGSILGRRFASDGTPLGGDFEVTVNPNDEFRIRQGLAMAPDGAFLVTYEVDTAMPSVFGRLYDSNGTPLGNDFAVSTDTTYAKDRTAVAAYDDGRFQVVWQSEGQDGSGGGVYTQTVDTDGTLLGPETRVHRTTGSNQRNPAVAIGTSGVPIYAWQSPFEGSTGLFTNCDGIGPCDIFADGFESGDAAAWSDAQPMP